MKRFRQRCPAETSWCNPGACGIFIAGGTNNQIVDNVIYGSQRPVANVGIYVWNQSAPAASATRSAGQPGQLAERHRALDRLLGWRELRRHLDCQ